MPYYPLHGDAGSGLRAAAERTGATENAVKLAWLLRRSSVVLPIPGTLSLEHLRDNLSALDLDVGDAAAWRVSVLPNGGQRPMQPNGSWLRLLPIGFVVHLLPNGFSCVSLVDDHSLDTRLGCGRKGPSSRPEHEPGGAGPTSRRVS